MPNQRAEVPSIFLFATDAFSEPARTTAIFERVGPIRTQIDFLRADIRALYDAGPGQVPIAAAEDILDQLR